MASSRLRSSSDERRESVGSSDSVIPEGMEVSQVFVRVALDINQSPEVFTYYALTLEENCYYTVYDLRNSLHWMSLLPSPLAARVKDRISTASESSDDVQRFPSQTLVEVSARSFRFSDPIGEGSFGTSFRERYREVGPSVVVKLFHNQRLSKKPQFRAQMGVLFNLPPHVNVVRYRGYSSDPVSLVSDYVHEGPIMAFLSREKSLRRLELLVSIVAFAAVAGLIHLHSHDIVHRTLAARNVLWCKATNGWLIKVKDYGLYWSAGTDDKAESSDLKYNDDLGVDESSCINFSELVTDSEDAHFVAPEEGFVLKDWSDAVHRAFSSRKNTEILRVRKPFLRWAAPEIFAFGQSKDDPLFDISLPDEIPAAEDVLSSDTSCPFVRVRPSQLDGNGLFTKQSDVYCFSILIWELMTGEAPFSSLDALATSVAIAKGLRPAFPAKMSLPLRKLVLDCWSSIPSERYVLCSHSLSDLTSPLPTEVEARLGVALDELASSLDEPLPRLHPLSVWLDAKKGGAI